MKINPISRRYKAKALTNPFPSYVSLVKAGANQRPIRAIKMAGFKAEENEMKIKRADAKVAAVVSTGFDLVSLKFDSATFADEAAVKAWLDDGGYEDYQIVATKSGFEVVNDGARVETGTAQKIKADDGVDAFIARSSVATVEETPEGETTTKGEGPAGLAATQVQPEVLLPGTGSADGKNAGIGAAILASPGHTEVAVVDPEQEAATRALADSGLSQEDWDKLSPEVQEESIQKAKLALQEEKDAGLIIAEQDAVVQPGATDEGIGGVDVAKTEGGEATPAAPEEGASAPNPDADLIARATAQLEELKTKVDGLEVTTKRTSLYVIGYVADAISTLSYLIQESDWNGISDTVQESLKTAARAALDAFLQASVEVAATYSDALDLVEDTTTKTEKTEAPAAPAFDMAALGELITKTVKDATAELSSTVAGVVEQVTSLKSDLDTRVDALETRGQTRKGAVTAPVVERSQEPAAETPKVKAHRGILSAYGSRRANS